VAILSRRGLVSSRNGGTVSIATRRIGDDVGCAGREEAASTTTGLAAAMRAARKNGPPLRIKSSPTGPVDPSIRQRTARGSAHAIRRPQLGQAGRRYAAGQFVACGADSRVHSPLIIAAAACSDTGARMFRGQRDVTSCGAPGSVQDASIKAVFFAVAVAAAAEGLVWGRQRMRAFTLEMSFGGLWIFLLRRKREVKSVPRRR
jgi:hypothetical protein